MKILRGIVLLALIVLIFILGINFFAKNLISYILRVELNKKGIKAKVEVSNSYTILLKKFNYKDFLFSDVAVVDYVWREKKAIITLVDAKFDLERFFKFLKNSKLKRNRKKFTLNPDLNMYITAENLKIVLRKADITLKKLSYIKLRKIESLVAEGDNVKAVLNNGVFSLDLTTDNLLNTFLTFVNDKGTNLSVRAIYKMGNILDWNVDIKTKKVYINFPNIHLENEKELVLKISKENPVLTIQGDKNIVTLFDNFKLNFKLNGTVFPRVKINLDGSGSIITEKVKFNGYISSEEVNINAGINGLAKGVLKVKYPYDKYLQIEGTESINIFTVSYYYTPSTFSVKFVSTGSVDLSGNLTQKEGDFTVNVGKILFLGGKINLNLDKKQLKINGIGNILNLFRTKFNLLLKLNEKWLPLINTDIGIIFNNKKIAGLYLKSNNGYFEILNYRKNIKLGFSYKDVKILSDDINLNISLNDFSVKGKIFDFNIDGNLKKMDFNLLFDNMNLKISLNSFTSIFNKQKLLNILKMLNRFFPVLDFISVKNIFLDGKIGISNNKAVGNLNFSNGAIILTKAKKKLDLKDLFLKGLDSNYYLEGKVGLTDPILEKMGIKDLNFDMEGIFSFDGIKKILIYPKTTKEVNVGGKVVATINEKGVDVNGNIDIGKINLANFIQESLMSIFKRKKSKETNPTQEVYIGLPDWIKVGIDLNIQELFITLPNIVFSLDGNLKILTNYDKEKETNMLMVEGEFNLREGKIKFSKVTLPLNTAKITISRSNLLMPDINIKIGLSRFVQGHLIEVVLVGNLDSLKLKIDSNPKLPKDKALAMFIDDLGLTNDEVKTILKEGLFSLFTQKFTKKVGLDYMYLKKGNLSVGKYLNKNFLINYSAGEDNSLQLKFFLNDGVTFTVDQQENEKKLKLEFKRRF